MSRSIDTRIVEMRFDNAQFERGVKDTTSLLDRLKEALKIGGKGTDDLSKGVSGFSLDGIGEGVDNISSKFSALGAIGFSVLQDLTRRALSFGGQMVSNFMEPIIGGGRKRSENMELAHFQFEGLGMDAEATMDNALEAVKGTAFGLDEAAVVAAQFGATGMQAGDDMADSLRGVAGVAAMTGASYSDIGQIFGKVAGQGRLMGSDLLRLGARGVNAAATIAEQMGITENEVREMVTAGEISFEDFSAAMSEAFGEHATRANEMYSGSLANMRAALARVGASFFTPHLERQRDLFNAITPLIDRLNDALQPLMERLHAFLDLRYDNVIGFLEMLDQDHTGGAIIDSMMDTIGKGADMIMSYLTPIGDAFQEVFGDISIVEGIIAISDGLGNLFEALTLTEGGGNGLKNIFVLLFTIIKFGVSVVSALIAGVVRVGAAIFPVTNGILMLVGAVSAAVATFIGFIDRIGLVQAIIKGLSYAVAGVVTAFMWLGQNIGMVINLIPWQAALDGVRNFLDGLDPVPDTIAGVTASYEYLKGVILAAYGALQTAYTATVSGLATAWDYVSSAVMTAYGAIMNAYTAVRTFFWRLQTGTDETANNIKDRFAEAFESFGGILEAIGTIASYVADRVVQAFKDIDLDRVLAFFQTGVGAAGIYVIWNFLNQLREGGEGITKGIENVLGTLTNYLKTLQQEVRANMLVKIAGSVLMLVAAVALLSLIDPDDLALALTGVAGAFAIMLGAMGLLTKMAASAGFVKMPLIAASMILLAAAMLVMTVPLMILSNLDWDEIARGLTAFAGILASIAAFSQVVSKSAGSITAVGLAMIPLSVGMVIMAGALYLISLLDWEDIAKGLVTVGVLLVAIGAMMRLAPPAGMIGMGVGLLALSAALMLLVAPLERFSNMTWEEIAKGLVMLGGAMAILAVGLSVMKGTVAGSLALSIAAGSMWILAPVLETFSKMGWEEIAKGLVMFAGALGILAGGLYLMTFGIVGAAALIIAAAAMWVLMDPLERMADLGWAEIGKILTVLSAGLIALAVGLAAMTFGAVGALVLPIAAAGLRVLVPVLEDLAGMEWSEIWKAIGALGALFAVLAIGGLIATPAAIGLIALGAAMVLLGTGLLAAGAAAVLFATAVGIMGFAVDKYGPQLLDMLDEIIVRIPKFLGSLADGVAEFIAGLARNATLITDSLNDLLGSLLQVLEDHVPTLVGILLDAFDQFLDDMPERVEKFGEIARAAIDEFVTTLEEYADEHSDRVNEALWKMVIDFAKHVDANVEELIEIGASIVRKIIDGIFREMTGLEIPASTMVDVLKGFITQNAIRLVENGGEFISNIKQGFDDKVQSVKDWGWELITEFVMGLVGKWEDLKQSGRDLVDRIKDGIDEFKQKVEDAGGGIIGWLVAGLTGGFGDLLKTGGDAVGEFIKGITGEESALGRAGGWMSEKVEGGWNNVKDFFGMGSDAGDDTKKGIQSQEGPIESAGSSAGDKGGKGIKDGLNGRKGEIGTAAEGVGESISSGMTRGMTISGVVSRATEIARSALSAARSALDSSSPSKEFIKIGQDISDGWAIGIDNHANLVSQSSENVANDSIEAVKRSMSRMPDGLDMIDTNPVIRPVLDLSEVRAGAERLTDILGGSNASLYSRTSAVASQRRQHAQDGTQGGTNQTIYNFDYQQHNTSPKALSTSEIYRRTKNQISLAKEALNA